MTVRADITGRYANRMYAYEPSDIKLCKYQHLHLLVSLAGFVQDTTKLTDSPSSSVISNMQKAKKLLKSELWARARDAETWSRVSDTMDTN